MKDYYELLGVTADADSDEIKRAYRRLAMQFHPDHHQDDPDAVYKLKEINEAYEILKNPIKRKQYDAFGAYAGKATPIEDFVQDFVSDFLKPFKKWTKSSLPKGADLRFKLEISLEESAIGCEKQIQYTKKENGFDVSSTLVVSIPAGLASGQRLRIQGAGDSILQNNQKRPGDLFVIVNVTPHPLFKREGANVVLELPVTITQAVTGFKGRIPTIYGSTDLNLSASQISDLVRYNKSLQLPQLGFTKPKSVTRGDMFLKIVIDLPEKLSPAEKNLFEQLAKVSKNYPLVREFQNTMSRLNKGNYGEDQDVKF